MEIKFYKTGLKLILEISRVSDIERLRETRQVIKKSQPKEEMQRAISQERMPPQSLGAIKRYPAHPR